MWSPGLLIAAFLGGCECILKGSTLIGRAHRHSGRLDSFTISNSVDYSRVARGRASVGGDMSRVLVIVHDILVTSMTPSALVVINI